MRPGLRVALMLVAVAGLGGLYVWGATGLPDFGTTITHYGSTIDSVVSAERQTTNAVSAVVFDYRGFDTLGEELILFISVVAVTLLLRERRDESSAIAPQVEARETHPRGSPAVRALGVPLVAATLLIGLYVVAHGHLTPGGGFQGGIVIAAAGMALYATGDFRSLRALVPAGWMEVVHCVGAAGLALIGLGGLLAGGAFFHNFLSTGTAGLIQSGGTIPLGNAVVGLEVAGALLLLTAELLHDAAIERGGDGDGDPDGEDGA